MWRMLASILIDIPHFLIHPRRFRWRETLEALSTLGAGSFQVITLATAFAGIVITHEMAWHMQKALHSVAMVPGMSAQFIVRELAVAVPALLLVSKVGASLTAEIATMKITDQIDALRLLGINPLDYLLYPRLIACTVAGGALTLISILVTLLCSVATARAYHFSPPEYLALAGHFMKLTDVIQAVIKGSTYGAIIPIMSCAYGFCCRGGAEGVGHTTTQSVVASTLCVIVLDFILTMLFSLI